MFGTTRAYSGFAVTDLSAAKRFYEEILGLAVEENPAGLTLRIAGDRPILVYAKPDHTPATYTILNFPVDNVEKAVDELVARGVRFERYEGFEQDEKGIHRGTWWRRRDRSAVDGARRARGSRPPCRGPPAMPHRAEGRAGRARRPPARPRRDMAARKRRNGLRNIPRFFGGTA
jgi:catechol 2,3-dioxygenase-like lactoylglutathione lyase family enzyme